jgi:hypothetical protein
VAWGAEILGNGATSLGWRRDVGAFGMGAGRHRDLPLAPSLHGPEPKISPLPRVAFFDFVLKKKRNNELSG